MYNELNLSMLQLFSQFIRHFCFPSNIYELEAWGDCDEVVVLVTRQTWRIIIRLLNSVLVYSNSTRYTC